MHLRLSLMRIQKEEVDLLKNPLKNVLISRDNFNFHFCIYGLQGKFEKGFFHGVLQLSEEYPLKPPNLRFFTPNGIYSTMVPICTNFTNFHSELWNNNWTIRAMLNAIVDSFQHPQGGTGSISLSIENIQKHAYKSLKYNLQNRTFCKLFQEQLVNYQLLWTGYQKVANETTFQLDKTPQWQELYSDRRKKSGAMLVFLMFLLYLAVHLSDGNQL